MSLARHRIVSISFLFLSRGRVSLIITSHHSVASRAPFHRSSDRTKPSNSYCFVCRLFHQTGTAVLCVRERPSTTTRLSPSHMNVSVRSIAWGETARVKPRSNAVKTMTVGGGPDPIVRSNIGDARPNPTSTDPHPSVRTSVSHILHSP